MLRVLSILFLSLLCASRTTAQTTGVPNVNDLQIRLPPLYVPTGSGTTSCGPGTNQGFIPGAPFPVAYETTSNTATAAVLLLDFFNPCSSPGFAFFPAQPVTCAGPIAGGTNVWYALGFAPVPVAVVGVTNALGYTRWNFNVPLGPGTVWAQCLFLDTCSSLNFKFSQALGFSW